MKKFLLFVCVISFTLFASCDLFSSGDEDVSDSNGNNESIDTEPVVSTTLTIKNLSFSDITEVKWNNITFEPNGLEKEIEIGNFVKKDVKAGYGYIYFKRKSNPVFARTKAVVTVNEGEQIEFVFTDNTLIVEQNNAENTGTLSALNSTVVFFDDAEGELQKYETMTSGVFYSENRVKNGKKSIFFYGDDDNYLELKVNLERDAEVSFWYTLFNKYASDSDDGAFLFSIDGEETFSVDGIGVNWSFKTFPIASGEHTLIFQNLGYYDGNYVGLDDILIVYTE